MSPEFRNEVGKIPPCFLPVGNKKLIEHQVDILNSELSEPIFLSLPQDYKLNSSERYLLNSLGIEVVSLPSEFSLAENILFVLNTLDFSKYGSEKIRLLHGDTLIEGINKATDDCIGIGLTNQLYDWEQSKFNNNSYDKGLFRVWCGFFSFSCSATYIRALALSRGDFVQSVYIYQELKCLKEVVFEKWFDCGHINSYFKTRGMMTTERAFNKIKMIDNVIHKTSEDRLKLDAEASWFRGIPPSLKRYIPQLIDTQYLDSQVTSYSLEYLPNLPLNELFVHGRLHPNQWINIINKIISFTESSRDVKLDSAEIIRVNESFNKIVIDKTYSRIEDYSLEGGFDLDYSYTVNGVQAPPVKKIIERCIEKTLALNALPSIIHGDLCFSNILYDSRINDIKLIDPRGVDFEGNLTIYGDQKYDIAKLTHSMIGLYDYIIANRYVYKKISPSSYRLEFHTPEEIKVLQQIYINKKVNGVLIQDIMPLTVLLFLSMLPLHSDRRDRQNTMFVNAIRIYNEYVA